MGTPTLDPQYSQLWWLAKPWLNKLDFYAYITSPLF
jgi:hypothetical protein